MDQVKLRAYWAARQGLDGSLAKAAPAEVLARTGWARSVGGFNPYMTLFSRAGTSAASAEKAVADGVICELPSARGCTYFLPEEDYGIGLKVGAHAVLAEVKTCERLGVERAELDRLAEAVLAAVGDVPMDPRQLKDELGGVVRNLGEAGKKKGVTTTLPVVLGVLQSIGEIKRVPVGGRLDQQRFGYVRWTSPPAPSLEDARMALAERYWSWIGIASLAHFRWFSGMTVKEATAAVEPLALHAQVDGDLLIRDPDDFGDFKTPREPNYALVSWIDGLTLLRRDLPAVLDDEDAHRELPSALAKTQLGGLGDLPAQAIFDRGRLAGLWEFDPDEGKIVWVAFRGTDDALQEALTRAETFIRDELGDARGMSLDSIKSRAPRLAAIRSMR